MHNLANANTIGFRADLSAFQTQKVTGAGLPSRAYATDDSARLGFELRARCSHRPRARRGGQGAGLDRGAGQRRHRSLHARRRSARRSERRADDRRRQSGARRLRARSRVPPHTRDHHRRRRFGLDRAAGTDRADRSRPSDASSWSIRRRSSSDTRRRRLVPQHRRRRSVADASVQLVPGTLESSNVNIAETMANMIELARNYEVQVKAMKTAEDNAASSSKLLQSS